MRVNVAWTKVERFEQIGRGFHADGVRQAFGSFGGIPTIDIGCWWTKALLLFQRPCEERTADAQHVLDHIRWNAMIGNLQEPHIASSFVKLGRRIGIGQRDNWDECAHTQILEASDTLQPFTCGRKGPFTGAIRRPRGRGRQDDSPENSPVDANRAQLGTISAHR